MSNRTAGIAFSVIGFIVIADFSFFLFLPLLVFFTFGIVFFGFLSDVEREEIINFIIGTKNG